MHGALAALNPGPLSTCTPPLHPCMLFAMACLSSHSNAFQFSEAILFVTWVQGVSVLVILFSTGSAFPSFLQEAVNAEHNGVFPNSIQTVPNFQMFDLSIFLTSR